MHLKNKFEIIEKYIDYYKERDFVESLTIAEQVLYKHQIQNTISFSFFLAHERMVELAKIAEEEIREIEGRMRISK